MDCIEEVLDPSLALQTHDIRDGDRTGKGKRQSGISYGPYHAAFVRLVGTTVKDGAHQLRVKVCAMVMRWLAMRCRHVGP